MFKNGAIKRLIRSMKYFFNKTINDAIGKIFKVSLIFYNDYKNGFFFQSQIKCDGGNINLKFFLSNWDHHPFTSFSMYANNVLFEEKWKKDNGTW